MSTDPFDPHYVAGNPPLLAGDEYGTPDAVLDAWDRRRDRTGEPPDPEDDTLPPVPTPGDLATELGRVRYERDLLLHGVQTLETAIDQAAGPTAWRALQSIARFVEEGGVGAMPTNGSQP